MFLKNQRANLGQLARKVFKFPFLGRIPANEHLKPKIVAGSFSVIITKSALKIYFPIS